MHSPLSPDRGGWDETVAAGQEAPEDPWPRLNPFPLLPFLPSPFLESWFFLPIKLEFVTMHVLIFKLVSKPKPGLRMHSTVRPRVLFQNSLRPEFRPLVRGRESIFQ